MQMKFKSKTKKVTFGFLNPNTNSEYKDKQDLIKELKNLLYLPSLGSKIITQLYLHKVK